MTYPLPDNEDERLDALHQLQILDTAPEDAFTRLADIAKAVFDVEFAGISLLAEERQWFKATCGWAITETDREEAFCAHVVADGEVLVIEDARAERQFADLVRRAGEGEDATEEEGLQFYAGAPVTMEESLHVGTLCLADDAPRSFGASERAVLVALANVAADLLKARRHNYEARYLSSALEHVDEAVVITEAEPLEAPGPEIRWVNQAFAEMTGYSPDELRESTPRLLYGADTDDETLERVRDALKEGESVRAESVYYRKDGTPYQVEWGVAPVRDAEGRLTHLVSVQRDVTEERERQSELEFQATHDALTGLLGRAALETAVQDLLDSADGETGALLYLDLDRFKQVNDTLGHTAGDNLLKEVADRLRRAVGEEDRVARLGGDEFAILLPSVQTPESTTQVAERLVEVLRAPVEVEGQDVFVEASIGIVFGAGPYSSAASVIRDADVAMYRAKNVSTRSIMRHEQAMTEELGARFRLDADLHRGVEQSEFEPFFHPIINLEDGTLHGFEVLARWRRSTGEIVTPGNFLGVAEETGLIVPIGHQVIEGACQVLNRLQAAHEGNWTVSLSGNFSRYEFFRPETRTFVDDVLTHYDIAPDHFTMEVTERAIEGNGTENWEEVEALRDLGVRMEIDDFGTGFSSLHSLLEFPIDGLKVDKALMDELERGENGRELVRCVVKMGRTLDLTVTAEGIETTEQLKALREFGCPLGQGYLFSKPLPAEELESLLKEAPWQVHWTPAIE